MNFGKKLRKINILYVFVAILIKVTIQENIIQQKDNQIKKASSITFQDYIIKYNKKYQNQDQKLKRKQIFQLNVKKLEHLECFPCGVTKFTDKTEEEINKLYGMRISNGYEEQRIVGSKASPLVSAAASNTTNNSTQVKNPSKFDWRDYNVVTSIKDQGACGNCWAFSTVAFFQSELVRRGQAKNNIDLAEQFLLQCDSFSNGCNGGNLYSAMDLVLYNGLPFETYFPFNPQVYYPNICRIQVVARFGSSRRITVSNLKDDQIIGYLLFRPLNIPINAKNWHHYAPTSQSRTFKCQQSNNSLGEAGLNHAVLLVGYTETQWIVKNQWGKDWGVDGYIYITRQKKYNCGIGIQIDTLNYRLEKIKLDQQKKTDNNNSTKTAK